MGITSRIRAVWEMKYGRSVIKIHLTVELRFNTDDPHVFTCTFSQASVSERWVIGREITEAVLFTRQKSAGIGDVVISQRNRKQLELTIKDADKVATIAIERRDLVDFLKKVREAMPLQRLRPPNDQEIQQLIDQEGT